MIRSIENILQEMSDSISPLLSDCITFEHRLFELLWGVPAELQCEFALYAVRRTLPVSRIMAPRWTPPDELLSDPIRWYESNGRPYSFKRYLPTPKCYADRSFFGLFDAIVFALGNLDSRPKRTHAFGFAAIHSAHARVEYAVTFDEPGYWLQRYSHDEQNPLIAICANDVVGSEVDPLELQRHQQEHLDRSVQIHLQREEYRRFEPRFPRSSERCVLDWCQGATPIAFEVHNREMHVLHAWLSQPEVKAAFVSDHDDEYLQILNSQREALSYDDF